MIQIETLIPCSALWERVAAYAETCSWSAGKALAKMMRERGLDGYECMFEGRERVFAATCGGEIAGFCNLLKTDCVPNVEYTPYVGFVFVGEPYRGHRLSEKLIDYAAGCAKALGFKEVYLVSDHVGLYEKYGFKQIDRKPAFWGDMQSIYMRST